MAPLWRPGAFRPVPAMDYCPRPSRGTGRTSSPCEAQTRYQRARSGAVEQLGADQNQPVEAVPLLLRGPLLGDFPARRVGFAARRPIEQNRVLAFARPQLDRRALTRWLPGTKGGSLPCR